MMAETQSFEGITQQSYTRIRNFTVRQLNEISEQMHCAFHPPITSPHKD